eukprot:3890022-Amphidinium_carterae.1
MVDQMHNHLNASLTYPPFLQHSAVAQFGASGVGRIVQGVSGSPSVEATTVASKISHPKEAVI